MRSFGGLLLLAGIGVAHFVYLTPPVDNLASRSNQVLPAELADPLSVSRFSPSIPLSLPVGGLRLAGVRQCTGLRHDGW